MGNFVFINFLLIFSSFTWANPNYECGKAYEKNSTPWLVKVELVGRNDAGIRNGDFARCLGIVISPNKILTSAECLKDTGSKDLEDYTLEIYLFKDLNGNSKRGIMKFKNNIYSGEPSGSIRGDFAILNLKKELPKTVQPICLINNPHNKISRLMQSEWHRKVGTFKTTSNIVSSDLLKIDEISLLDLMTTLNSKRTVPPGIAAGKCNGKFYLLAVKLGIGSKALFSTFSRPNVYQFMSPQEVDNSIYNSNVC